MNPVSGTSSYRDPVCASLAGVFQRRRLRRGLNKAQLAKLAHVSKSAVGVVEARSSVPTVDMAAKISRGLGTRLSRVVAQAERRL